jgi:hypothetical protein
LSLAGEVGHERIQVAVPEFAIGLDLLDQRTGLLGREPLLQDRELDHQPRRDDAPQLVAVGLPTSIRQYNFPGIEKPAEGFLMLF